MIKRIIKYIILSLLTYLLICLATPFNKYLKNRSIENQISYVDGIMRKGFDDRLQSRFPEGKVFSNAIFSLSIIEFCNRNKYFEEKYAKILDQNIERILSKTALRIFSPEMKPKYGIFYNGWCLYVLKKYQRSRLFEFSKIRNKVSTETAVLEQRILTVQNDSLRILDSYSGTNWPADNLIGLLSMDNDTIQHKWLEAIFNNSEHESGLINHIGSRKSEIRGSSQALITFCLSEMGYKNVEEYNSKFQQNFIDNYLGVELVKENEDGSNSMDADSGPVVFGYGTSGTIVNIKTHENMVYTNSS